jgi:hypothetical protein
MDEEEDSGDEKRHNPMFISASRFEENVSNEEDRRFRKNLRTDCDCDGKKEVESENVVVLN